MLLPPIEPNQYTSLAFTEVLIESGFAGRYQLSAEAIVATVGTGATPGVSAADSVVHGGNPQPSFWVGDCSVRSRAFGRSVEPLTAVDASLGVAVVGVWDTGGFGCRRGVRVRVVGSGAAWGVGVASDFGFVWCGVGLEDCVRG